MRAVAEKSGLECEVDSAGTADYHIGSAPDPRAIETARSAGVDITNLSARQLQISDFYDFTHIFALDTANLTGIQVKQPKDATAKVSLLLDALEGRKGQAIKDPYYGDETDFQKAWQEILYAVNGVDRRLREMGIGAEF